MQNNNYIKQYAMEYIEKVNKYILTDNRELNYQNRVIIPTLELIFSNHADIDVVDTSTMYRNWEKRSFHTRKHYAGNYTPDILIAQNWNLENIDKENHIENHDIRYLCIIEVKKPNASDKNHLNDEKNEYLDKLNLIVTDSITWEFHYKNKDKAPEFIYLEESETLVCNRSLKEKEPIKWKTSVELEREFEKLFKKIKKFVNS